MSLLIKKLVTISHRCLFSLGHKTGKSCYLTGKRRTLTVRSRLFSSDTSGIVEDAGSEDNEEDEFQKEFDELLNDEEYQEIIPFTMRQTTDGHGILLIQPRVKWGHEKTTLMKITSPELQLEEGVALIETLDKWRVVDKLIVPTQSMNKRLLFGKGTLETLSQRVSANSNITAVVLGVNSLIGWRQSELENVLGVPVYDRYSIVLQIFNNHARTKESRLQVALAEIPYVRTRLREMTDKGRDRATGTRGNIAGSGESFFAMRKRLLEERALKLRKAIDNVKAKRDLLRQRRVKRQIPTVSIVGYTNSGKTSLIKSLTDDKNLVPKDHLFATLDVTVHSGMLPTMKQVLYVDTVGFIANIPTDLIEAFRATLQEVVLSDLIVHVQDISHPDVRSQNETVIQTLKDIEVSEKLRNTMILVGNKVDKLEIHDKDKIDAVKPDMLISATKGTNIAKLRMDIEKRLIVSTGRYFQMFRVPSGGEETQWLYKEASVREVTADPEDNNFLYVDALINGAAFGRFKRIYGEEYLVSYDEMKSFKQSATAANQQRE